MLASSLVEGLREAVTGPLSSLLSGQSQEDVQTSVDNHNTDSNLHTDQTATRNAIDQKESHIKVKPQWSSIIKTGASLILASALIGFGGPMFFGASLACGFMALQSISRSFKIQKEIVRDLIVEEAIEDANIEIIEDLLPWALKDQKFRGDIADGVDAIINEEDLSSTAEQNQPIMSSRMAEDTIGLERSSPSFMGGPRFFAFFSPSPDRSTDLTTKPKPKVTKVSLNAYETVKATILKDHKGVKIYIQLIKATDSLVEQFKKKFANIKDQVSIEQLPTVSDLGPWIGASADVITYNQPGFTHVMMNPIAHGYTYMVYEMTFKLAPYLELPYVGYAQNFDVRLRSHITDAFERHSLNKVSTHIDKAHLIAIERELDVIDKQITQIDASASIQDLNDLVRWFHNSPRGKKHLLTFIVNKVIKKHFTIKAIEFHKTSDSALSSEKAKTLALRHTIGGQVVTGTIFPNGLNMKAGGAGGGKTKVYPILDILLLASLGFKNNKIAEILTRVYKTKFTDASISNKIGTVGQIQFLALKPIFFEIFSYRDASTKSGFSMQQIADVLQRGSQFFRTKLSDWFDGLDSYELKSLIDTGVDLSDMSKYLNSVKRSIRYHTQQTWIDWIITSPTHIGPTGSRQVASQAGVSENSINSKTFMHQLATYLLGKNRIYSFNGLKQRLRKDRAIELLRRGIDPKNIMENTFQVLFQSNGQLRLFYEILFTLRDGSRVSRVSFDNVIYLYSSLPGYYLGKYK